MIKVTPTEKRGKEEGETLIQNEELPEIQQVLQEYEEVFREPKELNPPPPPPPSKKTFDHHIPLKEWANSVNARPYMYSLVKKKYD